MSLVAGCVSFMGRLQVSRSCPTRAPASGFRITPARSALPAGKANEQPNRCSAKGRTSLGSKRAARARSHDLDVLNPDDDLVLAEELLELRSIGLPPRAINLGRHDLENQYVVSLRLAFGLPQPFGRRAGKGREPAELLGKLSPNLAECFFPKGHAAIVEQRQQELKELHRFRLPPALLAFSPTPRTIDDPSRSLEQGIREAMMAHGRKDDGRGVREGRGMENVSLNSSRRSGAREDGLGNPARKEVGRDSSE